MPDNDKFSSRDFDDISQLTNRVLYSGATCHMLPQVSGFIPVFLEDMDKHIEVADGHYVKERKKGQSTNKNVRR